MGIFDKFKKTKFHILPAHPIAGTEFSGPEFGYAELFENRWCILSAENSNQNKQLEVLTNFWKKVGSKVKFMTFKDHDYVLSLTSHLPHAIAYSCLLYTSPSPRDKRQSRMPSSA